MTRAIFFKAIVLSTVIALLGCGSSKDSSKNIVTDPPQPAQDGITGSVTANLKGGQLSVHDANGDEIVLASGRTTGNNGSFHLIFSEFEINEGITPPLIVTVDGTNATATCNFDDEGDNDCLAVDGSFVPFGTTYILPNGFMLRGLAPTFPPNGTVGDRTITVNLSAASDLAVSYTGNIATLGVDDVTLASSQALGVVEFITGLSTGGKQLNEIPIFDLSLASVQSNDGLALALFDAAIHGLVDTEKGNVANYRRVLDKVEAKILPIANATNNYLGATGNFLSEFVGAYTVNSTLFQLSLSPSEAVLAGSIASQTTAIPLLAQAGENRVSIALPADPASGEPLDRSRIFASGLSEAMGATLLISQTAAFGGTAAGAALVYAEQLSLLSTLVSQQFRLTIIQLDNAIAVAQAEGQTELTGTNVSGVLAFEGDTVTMTTTTSTTFNIQTGVGINITIPSGTRDNPGANGVFDVANITIGVTRTENNLTTSQLFKGLLTLQMIAFTTGADVSSLIYSGDLSSTTGLEFSGDISISSLAPVDESQEAGDYDATFTFEGGSNLSLKGLLETQISLYSITTDNSTIMTDVETNTITDMNADLNLTLDQTGVVTGGTLTSAGSVTGSMDVSGTVSFSDDTAIALPVPVI